MLALVLFDGSVKYEAIVKPMEPLPEAALFQGCAGGTSIDAALTRALTITVELGGRLPHDALFVSCGGGTSIAAAFERGLEIIGSHPRALRKSDVVLITDGGSDPERAPELRERARALDVTSLGLAIEVAAETLGPWCDEAHAVSSVENLEENVAGPLFSS